MDTNIKKLSHKNNKLSLIVKYHSQTQQSTNDVMSLLKFS